MALWQETHSRGFVTNNINNTTSPKYRPLRPEESIFFFRSKKVDFLGFNGSLDPIILTLITLYLDFKEQLKEHQRTIQRAIRELDRERMRLEMSEKKLIMDIKKNAKQGQMVRHLSHHTAFHLFLLILHTHIGGLKVRRANQRFTDSKLRLSRTGSR